MLHALISSSSITWFSPAFCYSLLTSQYSETSIYHSQMYNFPVSIVLFEEPRWKWWSEVSLCCVIVTNMEWESTILSLTIEFLNDSYIVELYVTYFCNHYDLIYCFPCFINCRVYAAKK
jgi:hypothetical protein